MKGFVLKSHILAGTNFFVTAQIRYDDGGFCFGFFVAFVVRMGLCNRLQRLPLSPSAHSASHSALVLDIK